MLAYQRLDVYQCAIRALALCARISAEVARGYSDLAVQLRRSALSICLNIAEGAGRRTSADAARFYAIARGSAMECTAILDACGAIEVGEEEKRKEAEGLLVRVVEMLSRMGVLRST